MSKAVPRIRLLLSGMVLSAFLVLNIGAVTASANVPPEADTGSETPAEPTDRNGTARGNGTGDPLTPDGNGTEVDSVDDNGKYFYTFQTDAGNYFYIVVDETREDKNVYVLSTVNEEELLTLCDTGEEENPDNTLMESRQGNEDLFGPVGGSDGSGEDGTPREFDLNGDGIIDAWDTNGDGKPDAFDTDGDGIPDVNIIGPGVVGFDTNGDGIIDAWDTNGDGIIDAYDTDGDGIPDLFGAQAAQAADVTGKTTSGENTKATDSVLNTVKDKGQDYWWILVALAAGAAGYYFKIYKPKHGPIGNSNLEFEDDPDYEDEDDNIYDFEAERNRTMSQGSNEDYEQGVIEEEIGEQEQAQQPMQSSTSSDAVTIEESSSTDEIKEYQSRREEARRGAEELKRQLNAQRSDEQEETEEEDSEEDLDYQERASPDL